MPRYDPSHPSTLAIYCSDGRFTHAVEDHCEDLGHERIDTMTLPGGPALLISGAADLSEVHVFSRAAHFLIEAHAIKHVFLFAHAGCGFYRTRFGRLDDVADPPHAGREPARRAREPAPPLPRGRGHLHLRRARGRRRHLHRRHAPAVTRSGNFMDLRLRACRYTTARPPAQNERRTNQIEEMLSAA